MYPIIAASLPDPVDLTTLHFSLPSGQRLIDGSAFLCVQDTAEGKNYIKLSKFNTEKNDFTGHEAITEVIVSRYLDVIGIPHLAYEPRFVKVLIEGEVRETVACISKDFCRADEEQLCLKDHYEANRNSGESVLSYCIRMGWGDFVDRMILTDYLIRNLDRYANNLILLKNQKTGAIRPAPLFDHGLSLLSETRSEKEVAAISVLKDAISVMYIGSFRVSENLKLIPPGHFPQTTAPQEKDRAYLFHGLEEIVSPVYLDRVWEMLTKRYQASRYFISGAAF